MEVVVEGSRGRAGTGTWSSTSKFFFVKFSPASISLFFLVKQGKEEGHEEIVLVVVGGLI